MKPELRACPSFGSHWAYGSVASVFWLKGRETREKVQLLDEGLERLEQDGHFGRCNCSCCACASCRPCCTSCCTGRNWLIVFGLFLLAVFAIGFTVQAGLAATEFKSYPAPGRIYSVSAGSFTVQMHLFCQGAGNTTVVFEHGGGASSVAGDGLMSELRMRGVRTCQYDRLGYGWTPSLVQRGGPNPTSGELLLNLLEVANEASSPMICVGHSAGAAACLEFAIAIANRTAPLRLFGVVMLDGYPDLVRAGSFPGGRQSINVILESLRGFAVMFGPTGLSRGM